jgi:hypothetical protein
MATMAVISGKIVNQVTSAILQTEPVEVRCPEGRRLEVEAV